MNGHILAAIVNLDGSGHYFTWTFLQISAANLVVIVLIVLAFVAALLLPFPGHGKGDGDD